MNQQLNQDLLQLDLLLEAVKDQGLAYLAQLPERQTSAAKTITEKSALPETGIGTSDTLQRFNELLEPVIVAASGPRYWGFVTGGTTPAAIAGDWLTTIYDQNAFATRGQGDISAVIELETIRLMLELLELPPYFLGGFVTGATMSNFSCLAVARQWIGRQSGKDFAREGISGNINLLTATPHSSSIKSLALLGIGSSKIIRVDTAGNDREAIDMADLEHKIRALDGAPFILISAAGTVNTADFDDFRAISKLRERYTFWWHIDAAFGGFAICSETHKHLLNGWEYADSITIDCHKWMNVPYENAVFLIREEHKQLQAATFQNTDAPYLGDPLDNFSYLNFLPENSRRLKALPVWFSLMAYGKKGFRDIVSQSIHLSGLFARFITDSKDFELLAPLRLNTVCFSLAGRENGEQTDTFLSKLNDTGKVFMTPTVYKGQKGIRAAFVNWRTTEQDIALATRLMTEIIRDLV